MDSDEENADRRNDVLSQSYAECVERVAQRKNDGGINFSLPKEVLEEREKIWDNFFEKYADEASDEVELDMNTLKPVTDTDKNLDADEDGKEDNEYFSKCRAPLRKLPDLIQYWIDTGNPPYRLVVNDDNSDTGSSLSEDAHSRSGRSDPSKDRSELRKSDTSRCSSVDTAAYILSNTNVTKKIETMAIIEGAKNSSNENVNKNVSHPRESAGSPVKTTNNTVFHSPNRNEKSSDKIVHPTTPKTVKTNPQSDKSPITTPLKASGVSVSLVPVSKRLDVSSPEQQSVKLSEILPELQQFDEMLKRRTRSPLRRICQNPEPISPVSAIALSPQESTIFNGSRNKLNTRKKLYRNTDSPVDLANEPTNDEFVQTLFRRSVHPALEIAIPKKTVAKRLAARSRTLKKRKRRSQLSKINIDGANTSQESDRRDSKDNGRYTDFFESLGLTPNGIFGGKSRSKRPRNPTRTILPRRAKHDVPANDSIENSRKESPNTSSLDNSANFSPEEKSRNCDDDRMKNILGDKIPTVIIERLPERFLARYSWKTSTIGRKNGFSDVKKLRIDGVTIGDLIDDNEGPSELEKIELLTTQDSDSSTIIICSCNDDDERTTDTALTLKKSSQTRMKLRSGRSALSSRTANNYSVHSEIAKIVPNKKLTDVFVKLEQLKMEDFEKPGKIKNCDIKIKSTNDVEQKCSKMRLRTRSSPRRERETSDVVENEDKTDFLDRVSNIAIDEQIVDEKNDVDRREKSTQDVFENRRRCNRRISLISDDDEDSFVKLVSELHEIGSEKDSTKLTNAIRKKTEIANIDETRNSNDKNGKFSMQKSQRLFQIFSSSDEDDVYAENTKKRRAKNLNLRNKKNVTVAKMTEVNSELIRELVNCENVAMTNDRLDESNRRKLRREKNSKENADMDINKNEEARITEGRRKTRRSTRYELSPSRRSENQISPTNSLKKSKDTNNIFRPPSSSSSANLPADPKDSSPKNYPTMADNPPKLKNLKTARTANDKKIIKYSFRTRLNCDSDTTSESHRSSLNDNNIQPISKVRSNYEKIPKSRECKISHENQKINREKLKKQETNLFDEKTKSLEKCDYFRANEVTKDVATRNVGSSSTNELPTEEAEDLTVDRRKLRSRSIFPTNLRKSVRSKNLPLHDDKLNGQSRSFTILRKRNQNIGKNKILGNLGEWQSDDDDTDSNEYAMRPKIAKQTVDNFDVPINGDVSDRLIDERRNNDRDSSRTRRKNSKNLFSRTNDDTFDNEDLIFVNDEQSIDGDKVFRVDELNFLPTKTNNVFRNLRTTSMSFGTKLRSFRTRIRSDTDDDGES